MLDIRVADNIHRPSIAPSGSESGFPMWLDDFLPRTTNMDSPTVSRDSEYPAISARSSFGGMDDLGPTMLSTDSGYGSTTYNTSAGVDEASSAGPPVSSLNPFLAAPNEYDFFNTMTPAPSGPESGETFDSGYYETGLWDEMSLAMPPANSGDAFHSTNNVFGSEDPYIHSGMDEVNSTMLFADVTFSSWDTSDGADRVSSSVPMIDPGDASISVDRTASDTTLPRRQDHQNSCNDSKSIVFEDGGLVPLHGESSLQHAGDDDKEGSPSIYTEEHVTSSHKQRIYISHLSDDLFSNFRLARHTDEVLERIHNVLPRLLKGFALRLGHCGSTQIHRDVMIFIRRHRQLVNLSLYCYFQGFTDNSFL